MWFPCCLSPAIPGCWVTCVNTAAVTWTSAPFAELGSDWRHSSVSPPHSLCGHLLSLEQSWVHISHLAGQRAPMTLGSYYEARALPRGGWTVVCGSQIFGRGLILGSFVCWFALIWGWGRSKNSTFGDSKGQTRMSAHPVGAFSALVDILVFAGWAGLCLLFSLLVILCCIIHFLQHLSM